jgi:hypothetical protein
MICMACGLYLDPATRPAHAPTLREGALVAEYTAGQAPSGEWFALGSVRGDPGGMLRPALIMVGAGVSHDTAVVTA